MKYLIGIILLFVLSAGVSAQEQDVLIFRGKVFDKSSGMAIPYVNIISQLRHYGTAADENGEFTIYAIAGDTLVFTAIGFESFRYYVNAEGYEDYFRAVVLEPAIYSIQEVDVFPFRTYAQFKSAVLNTKLQVEEYQFEKSLQAVKELAVYEAAQAGAGAPVSLGSPITALYNKFSKEGKELREYQRLVELDSYREQLSRRYNSDLITHITGIDDQGLIEKFMAFCNFSDSFILKATDYELYLAVNECFDSFTEGH